MSAAFLIIDGYNLMHAAGLARSNYGPGDLAKQRHLLLVKLTKLLTAEQQKRCTVVFDAVDAPPNLPPQFRHEHMKVVFADRGHEADEMIELLIRQHSAPRRLVVVSSDHRLQKAISRRRGTAVDSDVFLKQFESPNRQIAPTSPSATTSSLNPERELKFWMEEFEGIQPAKLARDEAQLEPSETETGWDRQIKDLQDRLSQETDLDEWLDDSGRH